MNNTDEQMKVICHEGSHALVESVAGSGKTHTMVQRVLRLIEGGADPREILAVMFNRDAVADFKNRLRRMGVSSGVKVQTFHGLGLSIFRRLVNQGLLVDRELVTDPGVVARMHRQALKLPATHPDSPPPSVANDPEVLERFTTYVQYCRGFTGTPERALADLKMLEDRFFPAALSQLNQLCERKKVMFFSDMVYIPVMFMNEHPEHLEPFSKAFRHLIVDEYQDVNAIQVSMLIQLCGPECTIVAVGDIDQCIYEWRGSRPDFMLSQFEKDFPGAARFTLTRTFRFGHELSLAASQVISNNTQRTPKLCISANPHSVTRLQMRGHGAGVSSDINEWVGTGGHYSDIAVLTRLYSMSVLVELDLLANKIPYWVMGGQSAVLNRVMTSVLGWCALSCGMLESMEPEERSACIHAMLTFPPLGQSAQRSQPIIDAVIADGVAEAPGLLREAADRADRFAAKKMTSTSRAWAQASRESSKFSASGILDFIVKSLEIPSFIKRSGSRDKANGDLHLLSALQKYARNQRMSAAEFTTHLIGSRQEARRMSDMDRREAGDRVLITSIHRAKGLEWPVVIMPGLDDSAFPVTSDGDLPGGPRHEDERRLFYVGMTRARQLLIFLHPEEDSLDDWHNGRLTARPSRFSASRFLYEFNLYAIDLGAQAIRYGVDGPELVPDALVINQYLEAVGSKARVQEFKKEKAPREPHLSDYAPGDAVRHPKLGRGVVSRVQMGSHPVVVVKFDCRLAPVKLDLLTASTSGLVRADA